ncbi:MAG: 7-carboxy-7-deazaguanine synthase QueE [Spirochaetae bacterium HGW-Spirochaetae-1]|jgi:7-carboxy-7-deazaguanine synthase|nr:MAG: 7-carboxy-7-deazaguanine synthase QueE [Spirochaetae bacterium HGW-Spirochaetae-1]
MKLIVKEIFFSLQGETTTTGFPSLFIRLTGCNLRCRYCDSEYAWNGGSEMEIAAIMAKIHNETGIHHITITGGEPLCQENVRYLIKNLCDGGYNVQIETNGSLPLEKIDARARKIVDVKTPSSGEDSSFLMENLTCLNPHDEIKFVIGDTTDYNFARDFTRKHLEKLDSTVNFSPVYGNITYNTMASWILRDRLMVRLNLQLHKIAELETDGEKNFL